MYSQQGCTPGHPDAPQCLIVLQAALSAAVQERDVADAALSDAREQNEEMKEVCNAAGIWDLRYHVSSGRLESRCHHGMVPGRGLGYTAAFAPMQELAPSRVLAPAALLIGPVQSWTGA